MTARLASWAPLIWALPWFVADVLLRRTSLLGAENPGGVKEAHPALWPVFVVGVAVLVGYQAFTQAKLYRGLRGVAAGALMLVLFGGFQVLGGPAWGFTMIALFVTVFVLEFGGSALERRREAK